jgi:hypothetical protein
MKDAKSKQAGCKNETPRDMVFADWGKSKLSRKGALHATLRHLEDLRVLVEKAYKVKLP